MRFFHQINRSVVLMAVLCLFFALVPIGNALATTSCVPGSSGLSWEAHPETDVTKFQIYQSDVSPADLQAKLGVSPMVSVPNSPLVMVEGRPTYLFKPQDLQDNKSYFFAVSAADGKGEESGLSNIVSCSVSLPPVPPTGLKLQ